MGLASFIYGKVVRYRNQWYERDPRRVVDAGVPVISIGNLTVGGTGKTPMAALIVQTLRVWGYKPAILTRGYMPKKGVESDEAMELRKRLRDTPVIVNKDRVAGAKQAIAAGADCLVLDDGFQHRRLGRCFDLVLVDALDPFGGDQLLPSGKLREPLASLSRAHAVIITRCNQAEPGAVDKIEKRIREHFVGPIARSSIESAGVCDDHGNAVRQAGQAVLLACAVGSPKSVERTIRELGFAVLKTLTWRDHHSYTEADYRQMMEEAAHLKAKAIFVTAKDWTKLRVLHRGRADDTGSMPILSPDAPPPEPGPPTVPIWRVLIQHVLQKGGANLIEAMRHACYALHTPKPPEGRPGL